MTAVSQVDFAALADRVRALEKAQSEGDTALKWVAGKLGTIESVQDQHTERLNRIETTLDDHTGRLDSLKSELGTVKSELGTVKSELGQFRSELRTHITTFPATVAEVMREVLRERRT